MPLFKHESRGCFTKTTKDERTSHKATNVTQRTPKPVGRKIGKDRIKVIFIRK